MQKDPATRRFSWASPDFFPSLPQTRRFRLKFRRFCRRESVEHAVRHLGLDQFKVVNDTCGRNAGDELLKQLTAKLRGTLRPDDVLARLGGGSGERG
ncbi:diguanylate cyclase domain-containing protein [Thiohalobacter sp.]|uniref:diguanylate cyclase domain-containing protein n=1 Tax=Thiohalobacter sp. TaxID=2025948 RepID=UPI00398311BF